MLKHVSTTSLSLRNFKNGSTGQDAVVSFKGMDTLSINSSISFSSSNSGGSSRSRQSIGNPEPIEMNDIYSRSSSSTSIQDIGVHKVCKHLFFMFFCYIQRDIFFSCFSSRFVCFSRFLLFLLIFSLQEKTNTSPYDYIFKK